MDLPPPLAALRVLAWHAPSPCGPCGSWSKDTCFSGEARNDSRPSPRVHPSTWDVFTLEAVQLQFVQDGAPGA